ncbi:sulfotransferase [Rhodobacteraceae bacterium]|nr:sulfotransferase [Paracoccaceae bacterium]
MSYSAAQLLKIAKHKEKLGETFAAFDAYSKVLNNFPSNITALRRRFDLDLLRKREPTTKSKESLEYEEINKKLELGVSDLMKLNLKKFIFDNPSATFAYPAYAKLFAKKEILRFVTMLRCLLENTQKSHHKYYLLQALFICAKREGHFGNAFKYLKKANDIKRNYLKYDPERDEGNIKSIKHKFEEFWDTSIFCTPLIDHRFIFIIGMPRSGTTLVEQTICNAEGVASVGEVPFATQFMSQTNLKMDLKVISQDLSSFYAAKIEKYRLSENHIIDKMPFNLFWVGFLAISFPNAQFVHCKRDARATCWSNYETSFAEGNQFSYKLNEIVRHYNNCEDLMLFWKSKFQDRIFTLDYDAFTEEPEIIGSSLFDFLQLSWKQEYLDGKRNDRPVKTASQLQVKKGIYRNSSQAWKNFEPFIGKAFQPLID